MVSIEKTVNKINAVDEKLSKMESKFTTLSSEVRTIKEKCSELESSTKGLSNIFDKVKQSCDKNTSSITGMNKEIRNIKDLVINNKESIDQNITLLSDGQDKLKETILDLQCRSMKNNLVFLGIPEKEDREAENCEETVIDFLNKEMQIVKHIDFGNVHRFGKGEKGPRPIVARLISIMIWNLF